MKELVHRHKAIKVIHYNLHETSVQVPQVCGTEGGLSQPGRRAAEDAQHANLALYILSTCTHAVAHAVHAVGLTCR